MFKQFEFNALKTSNTDKKLKSLSSVYGHLVRKKPPLRGFLIRFDGQTKKVVAIYDTLISKLLESITSKKLGRLASDALTVWEEFQSQQKGPTAPVAKSDIQKSVFDDLSNIADYDINEVVYQGCEEIIDDLFRFFGRLADVKLSTINFKDAWSELPSTTVRGFPFHDVGRNVDERIKELGGSTYKEAFKYFSQCTQNVCFPGWRIQGKPWPGPAKVRIVNIPTVYYQYLMVGITKRLMSQLKASPIFDGWKSEDERASNLYNAIIDADRDGFTLIQLDYSKFDRKFHPKLRNLIWQKFASRFDDHEFARDFINSYTNYSNNQSIFIGSISSYGEYSNIPLPYQLLSGVIDTQLTGSVCNCILQGYIARKLGYQIPWKYVRALGDDAVFPVPNDLLIRVGYTEVLKLISAAVSDLGFTINAGKAYPTKDVAFLQKLYVPEAGIKACGTWARSIASFMYKEKFAKPIQGIQSIQTLEIISQVSIISQAYSYGEIDLRDFSIFFADWWVQEDDLLRHLLQKYKSTSGATANGFFQFLIDVSGAGIEHILESVDSLSYDHTGLTEKLQSRAYTEVFKILPYLYNSSSIERPVRRDLSGLLRDEIILAARSVGDHVDIMED